MDRAPSDDPVLRLVDEYRAQCLWFLRGDLPAFRRVAEVRAWLSRRSSETSAAG